MKLVLSGKSAYLKKMYNHLRKEHPSVRRRILLAKRIKIFKGGRR